VGTGSVKGPQKPTSALFREDLSVTALFPKNRSRRPRSRSEGHLAFIRQLPCVICGDNTTVEAAHIRYGDWEIAKRPTGMGEKPDDAFTIPLCGAHHREQHSRGEQHFWRNSPIMDPIKVALALWWASGDIEAGEQIIRHNVNHDIAKAEKP
jgi:hypothetical protein